MLWFYALVATLALVLLVTSYNRYHLARAREEHGPRGEFLEVDGVRVHLVRQGTGPPVLCLHGLNGFLEDWTETPIVDELARDHEVVALDRPGYGHSTRPRQELSDLRVQADWLIDLMDALGWEDPAIVLGHSLGGGLAATLATRHPNRVAGLVLVGPYVNPRTEPDAWIHDLPRLPFLRSFVGHAFLVPVLHLLGPRYVSASFEPEEIPMGYHRMWVAKSIQAHHFDTTVEEIRRVDPALASTALGYPDVHVPTVVIAGAQDASVDPERNARWLVDELEDAELVWLEGVGHMVPWHHWEVVLQAVADVEAKVAQARGKQGRRPAERQEAEGSGRERAG